VRPLQRHLSLSVGLLSPEAYPDQLKKTGKKLENPFEGTNLPGPGPGYPACIYADAGGNTVARGAGCRQFGLVSRAPRRQNALMTFVTWSRSGAVTQKATQR
jgi:hypothetical protein